MWEKQIGVALRAGLLAKLKPASGLPPSGLPSLMRGATERTRKNRKVAGCRLRAAAGKGGFAAPGPENCDPAQMPACQTRPCPALLFAAAGLPPLQNRERKPGQRTARNAESKWKKQTLKS